MLKLAFDPRNQLLPLTVPFVLGVEKGSSFLVALAFQSLDLFLAGQLFLQCQCCSGGSAGLLELPVQLLDLAFQAYFEVIGPAVQLVGFGFEKAGITPRSTCTPAKATVIFSTLSGGKRRVSSWAKYLAW